MALPLAMCQSCPRPLSAELGVLILCVDIFVVEGP